MKAILLYKVFLFFGKMMDLESTGFGEMKDNELKIKYFQLYQ